MARETKRKREWEKFARSYGSRPKKGETEIGKAAVDRIVEKRTFEYFDHPTRGIRFHIFKNKGEELVGRLVSHAISNLRRNSSYAIEIEGGEIVEVFANRTLHKQLTDCFMQKIRIVYLGREQNNFGHAKKIYRVYTSKADRKRKDSDDGK
ncbi:hypothetical protein LCGC14_0829070 [marine sediment metagenome]|uniref:Uncharacterized protein n=1 Tax=marine sediment metagenome TaxID=412755 RepID=A0A0F9S1A6_9ZZZZ